MPNTVQAALLALAFTVASCGEHPQPVGRAFEPCRGDRTDITMVQGEHAASPLLDAKTTVRGVVTRVEKGRGFYLEDTGSGVSTQASRALFVAAGSLSLGLRAGQEVGVRGRVAELGSREDTLTSLVDPEAYEVCAESADLPLTRVELPLDDRARERLEGMRIALQGTVLLSDGYRAHEGEWTASAGGPLRQPTEDSIPGSTAMERETENRHRSISVGFAGPRFPAVPVGSTVDRLQGVLGHDAEGLQQLALDSAPDIDVPEVPSIDPPAAGHLRVVSANLLNYFNGDGRGGGFPAARGPRSPTEFEEQERRTQAAFAQLGAHLLGVQELENDGFGTDSAAHSLLGLLNASEPSTWAFIDPGTGRIGGDVITVGLFYRQDVLEPLGPAELLRGGAFEGRSRVPVAQLFQARASGERFLVAVNHLKSKGRCPERGPDADQNDGQGCWNRAREDAVRALLPWLERLAEKYGAARVLILGDMNAWRREDPIQAYRNGGYVELVEELSGLPQHSFLYFGRRGTLDYALASPALRADARKAFIWHINADWPREMELPQPWLRMSDHDPVVVDFDFSQVATSD